MKDFGRYYVRWDKDMAALMRKGYRVVFDGYKPKVETVITYLGNPGDPAKDYQNYLEWRILTNKADWESGMKSGWVEHPLTVNDFLKKINDETATDRKSLLGVFTWGHGGQTGILLNSYAPEGKQADYALTFDDWQAKQGYKLGLGVFFNCFSAFARSPGRIKAGTNVVATNGIFWGSESVMVFPLVPPVLQRLLRKTLEVKLGFKDSPVTIKIPDVDTILRKQQDVK